MRVPPPPSILTYIHIYVYVAGNPEMRCILTGVAKINSNRGNPNAHIQIDRCMYVRRESEHNEGN